MSKYTVDKKDYLVWEKKARLNKVHGLKFIISKEIDSGEVKNSIQLISTNPSDTAEEIISKYKIRWCIETFHRDIKQNLGFDKAFFRREKGIVSHSIFVVMAYAILSLFMYRSGKQMTIGECCEYLKNKSINNLVNKIVIIENRKERLNKFQEAFI